ncbi:class I SAM-dependent methyltransferase [Mesorhizobium sp. BR1-1-2]|nr:class I SAM-dependent methyltransferase [Mesorhizobium sp. BR1-1-2]
MSFFCAVLDLGTSRGGVLQEVDVTTTSLAALKNQSKRTVKRLIGYDSRNWLRIRQIEAFTTFLTAANRKSRDVIEISPGWNRYWKAMCPNYRSVDFPDFDICKDRTDEQYSIVIADQVLEHVQRPQAAARNIHAMTREGGWAMVATPFLFRVHARPHDYNRWTPAGLKQLMVDGGFAEDNVQAFGWGNKACARAHIGGPVRAYGLWRDLSNDEEYPMMVWAFAKKG